MKRVSWLIVLVLGLSLLATAASAAPPTSGVSGYVDQFVQGRGFVSLTFPNVAMMVMGVLFIWLAISKDYEPLFLVPVGFGILVGNIPLPLSVFNSVSVYMIDPATHEYVFNPAGNSVLGTIYAGVRTGLLPPLIFLGLGAMTDFAGVLSRPRNLLLGAASQVGIFATFLGAIRLGFVPESAAAIGIVGGADGLTAIYAASRLAPSLLVPVAIAAYGCIALAPILQPPILRLLTTRDERLIRMKPGRHVSQFERVAFPIVGLLATALAAPAALPLLGMLFFGNLLKETGVTGRLAKTAANSVFDVCAILLGFAVGASAAAPVFVNVQSATILALGCAGFVAATVGGVLVAKLMNFFSADKVNPLIGAAGVAAGPGAARVAHLAGLAEDPTNSLLAHAMGPNAAGLIGSALAAGVFLGLF